MGRAGCVVAERNGSIVAEENGASAGNFSGKFFGVLSGDVQVFRCDQVCEIAGRIGVFRQNNGAEIFERLTS